MKQYSSNPSFHYGALLSLLQIYQYSLINIFPWLAVTKLKYRVAFSTEQIVILDGYPRRDYGAVQFRFVVVLPHAAIPKDRLKQPLLTKEILSDKYLFGNIVKNQWRLIIKDLHHVPCIWAQFAETYLYAANEKKLSDAH